MIYISKTPEVCTSGVPLTIIQQPHKQKLVFVTTLRSKRTTPSILANNVSSPPRPTFSPG